MKILPTILSIGYLLTTTAHPALAQASGNEGSYLDVELFQEAVDRGAIETGFRNLIHKVDNTNLAFLADASTVLKPADVEDMRRDLIAQEGKLPTQTDELTHYFLIYNRTLIRVLAKHLLQTGRRLDQIDEGLSATSSQCDQRAYDQLWEERAVRVLSIANFLQDTHAQLDRFLELNLLELEERNQSLLEDVASILGVNPDDDLRALATAETATNRDGTILKLIERAMTQADPLAGNVDQVDDLMVTFIEQRERFIDEYDDGISGVIGKIRNDRAFLAAYMETFADQIKSVALSAKAYPISCDREEGYCPIDYESKAKELYSEISQKFSAFSIDYGWGLSGHGNTYDEYGLGADQAEKIRLYDLLNGLASKIGTAAPFKTETYFTNPGDEDLADGEGAEIGKLADAVLELKPADRERFFNYLQRLSDMTDAVRDNLYRQQRAEDGNPIAAVRDAKNKSESYWAGVPLDSDVPVQPDINISDDGKDDIFGINTGRVLYPLIGPLRNYQLLNEQLQAELRARRMVDMALKGVIASGGDFEVWSGGREPEIEGLWDVPDYIRHGFRGLDATLISEHRLDRAWLDGQTLGGDEDKIPDAPNSTIADLAERASQGTTRAEQDAGYEDWSKAAMRDLYATAFPGEDMDELRAEIEREQAALNASLAQLLERNKAAAEKERRALEAGDPKDAAQAVEKIVDKTLEYQSDVQEINDGFDDLMTNLAALEPEPAPFDAGAGKCPIPNVAVMDTTVAQAEFGCTTMRWVHIGEDGNLPAFPENPVYFDYDRGKLLTAFGPGDVLPVCVHPGGSDPLLDDLGRLIVAAPIGQTEPFSNGYWAPTAETATNQLEQLFNLGTGASSGLDDSLFEPPVLKNAIPVIELNPDGTRSGVIDYLDSDEINGVNENQNQTGGSDDFEGGNRELIGRD